MMPILVGCPNIEPSLLQTVALVLGPGLLLATVALVPKLAFARFTNPRPSTWATAALTALEPFAYFFGAIGVSHFTEYALQWHINGPVLAACIVFVGVAGLHGALLRRAAQGIGEARLLGLSLLYALPVPAIVTILGASFAIA